MSLTLGLSDQTVFDGLETVTVTSVAPAGNTPVTVQNAVGLEISRREVMASGGFFTLQDRVWWLPLVNLGTVVPKEGDSLQDAAGVTWNVLEVKTLVLKTQYRCVCHRQR